MMKQLLVLGVLALASLSPVAHAQTAPAAAPIPRVLSLRVYVTNLDRSEHFYREVFGFTAPRAYGDRERVFTLPGENAPHVALMLTTEHPSGSFAIGVADIAAVMRNAPAAGGAVVRPPRAMTGSSAQVGVISDPDGIELEVFQMPPG